MSGPRLGAEVLAALDRRLASTDERLARTYPGDRGGRQPVHTVYVPADRIHAGLVAEWGAAACAVMDQHLPTTTDLAAVIATPDLNLAGDVRRRVAAKLAREPIEDLRVDFEDGYGAPDDEDATAVGAARALAEVLDRPGAPPFCGLRIKSLEAATRSRGVRTLDLFLDALLQARALPEGFVVTLPKVSAAAQVEAMVELCAALEAAHALPAGTLRFEVQIEMPQAVLAADGTAPVARMVHAAAGRCVGLHYGTYDYSAACGVTAAYQSMEHPAADHAKAVMQAAAAGTGVRLSDGSTNVLPVGDAEAVLGALRLHARLVRRSLERAFFQGWDLHPAQLPTRFAATYAFYREAFQPAAARLAAYLSRTAGGVLDEPATARALAAALTRGLDAGALDEAEVAAACGLDRAALDAQGQRSSG